MQALPSALLVLATLGPLGVALATNLAPPPGGPVAAVFPPWWGAKQAVSEAGAAGAVIRLGAFAFVVIVAATDRAELRSHGAWLLLDPVAFGGCAATAS